MSDNYYVGNADPSVAAGGEYNAIEFVVRQVLSKMRTALRVKVIRGPYDKDGRDIPVGTIGAIGFVDVQPLVNQIDGRNQATPHGVVYRLSYHRYQSGYGAIIADPKAGDIGHIVAGDRDASSVISTGSQANPGSRRTYDMADGMYHGQVQAGAPEQYLTYLENGLRLEDKNGNKIEFGEGGIKITDKNGNVIDMNSGGIFANGAKIGMDGDVTTKHGTSLDHHVNTLVTPGSADTGPPP